MMVFLSTCPWKIPCLSNKITQHVNSQSENIILSSTETVDGWNPAPVDVGSLSLYLQGFIGPRWCRTSSINKCSTKIRIILTATATTQLLTSIDLPRLCSCHRTASANPNLLKWLKSLNIGGDDKWKCVTFVCTAWSGKNIFVHNVSCP